MTSSFCYLTLLTNALYSTSPKERSHPFQKGFSMTRVNFPAGFLWGTATAAHQVEGNNVNNDNWLMEHVPGTIFTEPSGDACDHYHRYADDITLLAQLGFNLYRFS